MLGDEYTRADSLGVFLSGASINGGAQADPDLSFGNYRSSTRAELIGFLVGASIPGIKIERLSPTNGFGTGIIEAMGADKLRWTPPNGIVAGVPITIPNGATRVLEGGDADPRKFIVVTRDSAASLLGRTVVKVVPVYNNAIGMSNVSDSERSAGETKIRCVVFRCLHAQYAVRNLRIFLSTFGSQVLSDTGQLGASGAGTIETSSLFTGWPTVGYCRIEQSTGSLREIVYYSKRTDTVLTVPAAGRGLLSTTPAAGAATDKIYAVPGMKFSLEDPVSEQFTQISNENDTSPLSGFSWSTGISRDTGQARAGLDKDEMVAVWTWLHVPAGAKASPCMYNGLCYEFGVYDLLMLTR